MTITKEDWDTKLGVTLVSQTSNANTFVMKTAAGGLAAGCGMIAKDRIVSIGGKAPTGAEDARELIAAQEPGEFEIIICRGERDVMSEEWAQTIWGGGEVKMVTTSSTRQGGGFDCF